MSSSPHHIEAIIDEGTSNAWSKEWSRKFPEAKVLHLSTYHLDHIPLSEALKTGTQANGCTKPKPRFRFEARWCLYENSKEVVQKSWNLKREFDPGLQVFNGIRNCRLGLLT
ncbi:hypothetical protein LIER_37127 [Lithospermum erythrorhizon]|uniref:Uncharacterized protein n=1 Tax=Lithospermum erythrorhizon TaxID=34254 RepID=A0AAV3PFM4_LITER